MDSEEPPTKKSKYDVSLNKMVSITHLDQYKDQIKTSKTNLTPIIDDSFTKSIELTKVYVGILKDMKNISKTILTLNEKLPLKGLQHLKRAQKTKIVICPINFLEHTTIQEYLDTYTEGLKDFFEAITVVDVPSLPPKLKSQFDVTNKIWPCNFHPNKHYERLVDGNFFDSKELIIHRKYMEIIFDIVKYYESDFNSKSNASIIVDPSIQSIVAVSFDNRTKHPIQHSAMLAIDNVAKTQNGGVWVASGEKEITMRGIGDNLHEYLEQKYPDVRFGAKPFRSKKDLSEEEINGQTEFGPYLCTDYFIYMLREPCIMCSMALVHARVKKVFFCVANADYGGLMSKAKLQTVSSLNHHFEVFTGFI